MKRVAWFSVSVLGLFLLSQCGSDDASKVKLFVGQLGNNPSGSAAFRPIVTPGSVASAVPSTNDFSYAVIDGLKMKLKRIDFRGATTNTSISFDNREVVLGDGIENVNIDLEVSASVGDYTEATAAFDNGYEVKAFCRTNDKLVYTANDNTIKTIACANNDSNPTVNCALPADYGFKRYEFAYITTSLSPTDTTDEFQETTYDAFSVGAGSTIRLLVDTRFTSVCRDQDAVAGTMSPFNWFPRHGTITDYFPTSTAQFGLTYIPIYTAVSNDTTFPTSETYMVANNTDVAELTATNPDFKKLHIVTFAFKPDGSILAARGRNFDAQTGLLQVYGGFTSTAADTFDIFNGEWATTRTDDASFKGGPVRDRKVVGFKRVATAAAPYATTIVDGPDAGSTIFQYEGQPRARAPIATTMDPQTLNWKRLR